MVGKHTGAATRVVDDFPMVVQSHCPAHRLDLTFSDAERKTEEELFGVLRSVYAYFNRSDPPKRQLDQWIVEYGCKRRGLVLGVHTRWLSIGTSLTNLRVIFKAVAQVLRRRRDGQIALQQLLWPPVLRLLAGVHDGRHRHGQHAFKGLAGQQLKHRRGPAHG